MGSKLDKKTGSTWWTRATGPFFTCIVLMSVVTSGFGGSLGTNHRAHCAHCCTMFVYIYVFRDYVKKLKSQGGWFKDTIWLVVGPPLWKIWKSIGMMKFPIYGKIKNGNQTTNQLLIMEFRGVSLVHFCGSIPWSRLIYTKILWGKRQTIHLDVENHGFPFGKHLHIMYRSLE